MTYIEPLIREYRSKGLLLDSNLLLLFLVGSLNPLLVGTSRYKKLARFDREDFLLLKWLIAQFARVVTTAHVLTEVSNLVNDLPEQERQAIWGGFASILGVLDERPYSSRDATGQPEFRYLGLTDMVLSTLAKDFLIVSNDGRMVNVLRERKQNALKWVEVLGLSA